MIQYETKNPWDAAKTEIFFNQSTNKLAYRDRLGIVFDLDSFGNEVQTLNVNIAGTVNVVYTDGTNAYLWDVDTSTYVAIGTRGTNYIIVKGTGTPAENAIELQKAYDYATTVEPNEESLSNTNRFTVIIYPGVYDFDTAYEAPFNINIDYVDVITISDIKEPNVIIKGRISVSASNVNIKGLLTESVFNVESSFLGTIENCAGGDYSFTQFDYNIVGTILDGNFINCRGGDGSFGYNQDVIGVFENCTGSNYSFGAAHYPNSGGGANGTFTNCNANNYSFGVFNMSNGEFTNCVADNYSFGYCCDASGIFTNCKGGDNCFGAGDATLEISVSASGIFTDCVAAGFSFGYIYRANGTFTRCTGTSYCFGSTGTGIATTATGGTFTDCTADNYSFGYQGDADGVFINCTGVSYCFGSSEDYTSPGICSGKFTNCTSTEGYSFGYNGDVRAGSVFTNCSSTDYSFGASDDLEFQFNGTFYNCVCSGGKSFGYLAATFQAKIYYCVANESSFNPTNAMNGDLYYCKLDSGSFPVVGPSGITRYCINGNNTTDNQG
jgi:hypothetical protein